MDKTIVEASQRCTYTIYNVTSSMKTMQDQLQPYDENAYMHLNTTTKRLEMEESNIHDKVYDNKHAIEIGLRIL